MMKFFQRLANRPLNMGLRVLLGLLMVSLLLSAGACAKTGPTDSSNVTNQGSRPTGQSPVELSDKRLGAYFAETKGEIYKTGLPEQSKSLHWTNVVVLDKNIALVSSVDCGPMPPDGESAADWDKYISECSMISTLHLYSLDGQLLKEIDLTPYLGATSNVVNIVKAPGESLFVLTEPNLMLGGQSNQEIQVCRLDIEGQSVSNCQKITAISTMDVMGYYNIKSDTTGNIYLLSYDHILMLDPKGQTLHKIKLEASEMMNNIFVYENQLYVDYSIGDPTPKNIIAKVDWDKEKFTAVLNQSGYEYNAIINQKIYVESTSGFSILSLEDGQLVPFMNWQDTDYYNEPQFDGMKLAQVLSDDLIVVATADLDLTTNAATVQLAFLQKQATNPNASKKIITLGGDRIGNYSGIEEAVHRFNQSQSNYLIRISSVDKPVQSAEDAEAITKQLLLDFTAGSGSDMMLINEYELMNYSQGQVLLDFDQLFEGDPDFNKSDYLSNIMKMGEVDGKQLAFPLTFYVNGLAMPEALLNSKYSWSFEEYSKIAATYPDSTLLDQDSYGRLFDALFSYSMNRFVDYSQKKVDINNQDFFDLLDFVKKQGLSEDEYTAKSMTEQEPVQGNPYKSKQTLLYLVRDLTPVTYAGMQMLFGEPSSVVGYPSCTKATAQVESDSMLVVNESTLNQDGIKDFIKYLLQDEAQLRQLGMSESMPVSRSALDKKIEQALNPAQPIPWIEANIWVPDIDAQANIVLTAQDAQRYKALMESLIVSPYDQDLLTIASEEAAAYFSGDKTAQQVAAIIENRLQTLLNERG